MPHRPEPIPALTGLRCVAALMVFVSHFPIPGVSGRLLQVTRAGYGGVTFFFVLSGFVLAHIYMDRFLEAPSREIGPYVAARLARIYPLYLICNLVAFGLIDRPLHVGRVVLALQAWSPDLGVAYALDGPGWSVGVEVFLYAMCPLVILGLDRAGLLRSGRGLALLGALVVAVMVALALGFAVWGGARFDIGAANSAHRWLYRMPAARLLDFTLGILACAFLRRQAGQHVARPLWAAAGYGVIAACLALMASGEFYFSAFSWDVCFAVPSVILILSVALVPRGLLSRGLGHPVMVALGEVSYAVYLIQGLVSPLMGGTLDTARFSAGQYVVFCLAVLVVSVAAHLGIERPARRWVLRMALPWAAAPMRP